MKTFLHILDTLLSLAIILISFYFFFYYPVIWGWFMTNLNMIQKSCALYIFFYLKNRATHKETLIQLDALRSAIFAFYRSGCDWRNYNIMYEYIKKAETVYGIMH